MTKEYIGEEFRAPYCEALKKGPVIWQTAFLESDDRVWEESRRLGLPDFNEHALYRFKPTPKRTVTLGGKYGPVELVAPERDALEVGCPFFYNNYNRVNPLRTIWMGNDFDLWALRNGNVFLASEDAQAMADFQRKQRLGEV